MNSRSEFHQAALLGRLSRIAGVLSIAAGAMVFVGWMFDIQSFKRISPNWVAMKANTAIAFILCGTSWWLLQSPNSGRATRRVARALAVAVAALAALTLGEYLFSCDLGIDEFLFRQPAIGPHEFYPGRMAPNSAFCFLAITAALLALGPPKASRHRLLFVKSAMILVALVGLLALTGYEAEVAGSYRLWGHQGMAVHTAVLFIALSVGVFAGVLREEKPTWAIGTGTTAAFVASLGLLFILSSLTHHTTRRMEETTRLATHTHEVRLQNGKLLSALQNLETWQRGYLLTRAEGFLEAYLSATNAIPAELARLRELTANNPPEQQRLVVLAPIIAARINLAAQTIVTCQSEGFEAGAAMVRTGKGAALMDEIQKCLTEAETEEAALGRRRQAESDDETRSVFLVSRLGELVGLVTLLAVFLMLNRAAGEREQAAERVRASAAYTRSLIEASLDPLVTIDAQGKITDVNEASTHATGAPREQLIGSDFSEYFTEPARAREGYRQVFSEGFVRDYPLAIRHVSGRVTDVLYNASVYRGARGQPLGVFAAARDITARKQAEEEIRKLNVESDRKVIERTAQLAEANAELQAFCYSISHDLRAPLRAIDGFSRVLLEDYGHKLDGEGRDSLGRVRAGAQRMGHLIDDLLKLSRLSRSSMHLQPVNLSALARTVGGELERGAPEHPVDFVVAPDVRMEGDAPLLRIMIENLLGNAWKFTSKQPAARVEFGLTQHDGVTACFVRDNGAGFDMRYAQKLFRAFQRLHSDSEFPGTGIGLATVQRIIHRHGGRVWAEAQAGKGATFYFTLPVPESNNRSQTATKEEQDDNKSHARKSTATSLALV